MKVGDTQREILPYLSGAGLIRIFAANQASVITTHNRTKASYCFACSFITSRGPYVTCLRKNVLWVCEKSESNWLSVILEGLKVGPPCIQFMTVDTIWMILFKRKSVAVCKQQIGQMIISLPDFMKGREDIDRVGDMWVGGTSCPRLYRACIQR